jgi:hypothetical protein
LTQRAVFYNPGREAYPWMSWSNAALPAAPDTEYHFPRGSVLAHSSKLETIDWQTAGPKQQADIKEMTGFFWKTKDVNAFGAYTPSLGTGLYHVADETIAPGIKLWSYGVRDDVEWSVLSTARSQSYIEIQGGPIGDQSVKRALQPNERTWHTEYWYPSDKALDIHALSLPQVDLRPVELVPQFGWARTAEIAVWKDLMRAHQQDGALPDPPPVDQNLWAPSGFEDLDAPFQWAIEHSKAGSADLWQFHYGTWLAGRGNRDGAVTVLTTATNSVGKVLLARLLKDKTDLAGAANAFSSVHEEWLLLHPQVVVERDQLLRRMGRQTLTEREYWLSQVNALNDEWIMERRVQLLIDQGAYEEAKALLLSVPFQKVHQTYNRTTLWQQLCQKLSLSSSPVPKQLGEDRLATFGAYREYE